MNPLNTLFDISGKPRRTGALNALGVQYARSNGSVDPNAPLVEDGAFVRIRLHLVFALGLIASTCIWTMM